MMDIRCPNKLHGILDESGEVIEIKCKSRWCGYRPGVVVVHKFSTKDWALVDTRVFRDPDQKGT
jgi:hypothetical protein